MDRRCTCCCSVRASTRSRTTLGYAIQHLTVIDIRAYSHRYSGVSIIICRRKGARDGYLKIFTLLELVSSYFFLFRQKHRGKDDFLTHPLVFTRSSPTGIMDRRCTFCCSIRASTRNRSAPWATAPLTTRGRGRRSCCECATTCRLSGGRISTSHLR